ncbi:MAG: beta-galactosidase [Eubacteriales bacterium]|nr:beta-galactosidase [Eubacteriales bacterium]
MKYPPIVKDFPHLLHGGDYSPEQWRATPEVWDEDMRLAKLAGCNTLSVGIFSWTALEPREGEYDFTWLDDILQRMAQNGMKAVLATPTGARPAWMSQKYPEVLRVDENRVRILHGARHNHCYTSPVYRRKAVEINTLLARRYAGHPALGVWHLSNEYGGECHCPLCQQAFRAWLKERYHNDLDQLNQAWWTAFWSHTYTDWSQIESPAPHGETAVHGLKLDWKRFVTEQTLDFMRAESAPLRSITPDVPLVTNMMGVYPGINYFRLADALDVAAWDSYPQWMNDEDDIHVAAFAALQHDLTRCLKDGKPFMLMESSPSATNWQPVGKLRRPGGHKTYSLQAVAHGADTVQYFQWRKSRGSAEKFHGAVVDHLGTPDTRVFGEVAQTGELLQKLDGVVGAATPAQVAILYDWENRWALEDSAGFLREKKYVETVSAHYEAFFAQGVPLDVIDMTKALDGYKIVVAPMLYLLRPGFAQRVEAFVKAGGTFVTTYYSGYVDEHDLCFLGGFPGPLKETLGIWCEELDGLRPQDSNRMLWQDKEYVLHDFAEVIHARGAQVLGTYQQDFYAGQPALTCHSPGDGKAYYIAARFGEDFQRDFARHLMDEAGVKPVLPRLPGGVSATARTNGQQEYVFVMNYMPYETRVDVGDGGTDMETGVAVAGTVVLPPRGALVFVRGAENPT